MTPNQVQKILVGNNINEKSCQIFPKHVPEGVLCLTKENESWVVSLNERGSWIIKEEFWVESDACKYFLKEALSDPTHRNDFKLTDLSTWEDYKQKLIKKYGLTLMACCHTCIKLSQL